MDDSGHHMDDSGNTGGSHMPPAWPSGSLGGVAPFVTVLAHEAWWMASRDGAFSLEGPADDGFQPNSQDMGDYDPSGDLDRGELRDHWDGKSGQSRSECKRSRA